MARLVRFMKQPAIKSCGFCKPLLDSFAACLQRGKSGIWWIHGKESFDTAGSQKQRRQSDATQDGRCPCDSFLPALKGGLFDEDQPYRLSGRKKPHRTLYVRQADRCVCFPALSIWGDGDIFIYNKDTTWRRIFGCILSLQKRKSFSWSLFVSTCCWYFSQLFLRKIMSFYTESYEVITPIFHGIHHIVWHNNQSFLHPPVE